MNENETKEAGREDMKEKAGGEWGAWWEEVSGCVCARCVCARVCVWWKEGESEKSDSLARQKKNLRSPQSLQSAGLMHIQLSISPHCPSFLINALLVGVNKHIHSVPKKKKQKTPSTLCLQIEEGSWSSKPCRNTSQHFRLPLSSLAVEKCLASQRRDISLEWTFSFLLKCQVWGCLSFNRLFIPNLVQQMTCFLNTVNLFHVSVW